MTTVALLTICLTPTIAAAGRDQLPAQTARTIVATWACQDRLSIPRTRARSPWKPHSQAFRQAELGRWQNRWRACTWQLKEKERQWNYTAWMPAHWQRLAQCESGSNPPNWRHSSGDGYEGAFGFAASSWDGFKPAGYPGSAVDASPWQQWIVARKIAAYYHSIAGSWGCWRGADHAWVRGGLPEHGTWQ